MDILYRELLELNTRVFIVMATYNGANFLEEQLDSLIAQSDSSWTLVVSDDGSVDRTLEIIQKYCQRDERIQFLEHEGSRPGSALANFSLLLNNWTASSTSFILDIPVDIMIGRFVSAAASMSLVSANR